MAADDSSNGESDSDIYRATRMGRARTNAQSGLPAGWSQMSGEQRANAVISRTLNDVPSDRRQLGMWDENEQPTIWDAVNYPRESEFEFDSYFVRYVRQSEAQAVIDKPANDTWQSMPIVHDEAHADTDDAVSDFEEAVAEFFEGEHTRRKPIHRLNVLDRLARLGEFGVMVLGFRDGRDPDTPVGGVTDESIPPDKEQDIRNDDGAQLPTDMSKPEFDGLDDLMYLAVYAEDRVEDIELNTDMTSERFRLPQEFEIVVQDVDDDEHMDGDDEYQREDVHWSRVIHVPEGTLEDDINGVPALKSVFHELLNIDKIKAASGEGFWRAGYQGLHVSPPTGRDGKPLEFDDGGDGVKEEIEDFVNNMDRNISTPAEINPINSQVGNPMPHLEANYQSIAAAKDIPKSILTGEDRADTADATDVRKWHQKIGQRRNNYAGPVILEPLLQRLIDCGVLPEPDGDGFVLEWQPLDEMTEVQQAELENTISSTIANLSGNKPTKFATIPELRQAIGWSPQIGGEVDDSELNEDGEGSEAEEQSELEVDEDVLPNQSEDELEYPDELYDTPREAETRAEELGIDGYHVMRVDGETKYMPGDSHDALVKAREPTQESLDEDDVDQGVTGAEDDESVERTLNADRARANADYTYSVNEYVEWDGKRGIVLEQHAADFKYAGNDVSVDDGDVKYVVAHEDGTDVVSESELSESGWHEDVPSPSPEEAQKANAIEFYDRIKPNYHEAAALDGVGEIRVNDIGFSDWPPTWEESEQPARLIALRAWAAMGGTFRGCRQELGSARLCAAFKDEIYQTTRWR